MNENEATFVMMRIGAIANKALEELDSLLNRNAGYESKMNFFMGFLAQLIEKRSQNIGEE